MMQPWVSGTLLDLFAEIRDRVLLTHSSMRGAIYRWMQ
jgi:hypothetical protein